MPVGARETTTGWGRVYLPDRVRWREENACIHLPRNMRPRTRHRRTLRAWERERNWRNRESQRGARELRRGKKGLKSEERMVECEPRLGQGHKSVQSTPAPPVIGSNHRGSHAIRSDAAAGCFVERKSRNGIPAGFQNFLFSGSPPNSQIR